jgi:hypothetical protein
VIGVAWAAPARAARDRGSACAAATKYRVLHAVIVLLASQQSQLTAFLVVLVFGLLIGVYGHLIHSRTLIVSGILVIGLVSAYFSFVLQPGGK